MAVQFQLDVIVSQRFIFRKLNSPLFGPAFRCSLRESFLDARSLKKVTKCAAALLTLSQFDEVSWHFRRNRSAYSP